MYNFENSIYPEMHKPSITMVYSHLTNVVFARDKYNNTAIFNEDTRLFELLYSCPVCGKSGRLEQLKEVTNPLPRACCLKYLKEIGENHEKTFNRRKM